MTDQAADLRTLSKPGSDFQARVDATRTVAVTSGKGGVGKTNVAVNLALALAREQSRVAILDADFGLANIDILLGLTPQLHLAHLLFGKATLSDILIDGPGGVTIVPASSGLERMTRLSSADKDSLWVRLHPLMARIDWLIIDTAAGIADSVMDFLARAEDVLLVCSDEPTSLVDAYALVKVLEKRQPGKTIRVVVNAVDSEGTAQAVFEKLRSVTLSFLKRDIDYLGWVAEDPAVPEAVRHQQAVFLHRPMCPASRSYVRLARRLAQTATPTGAGKHRRPGAD